MSIQVALPQVTALRDKVAEKVGLSLTTHNQFLKLVIAIEKELHEHISESTLERIWNYSTRQHEMVSQRSLDVLSQYVDFQSWQHFCAYLKENAGVESEVFSQDILSTKSLQVGDRLRIGWQPNRVCIIRYLGNYRFIAETTENSSMKPGDSFSCLQFQKNHELYLDEFQQAGVEPDGVNRRYAVGQEHGLSILEIIHAEEQSI